jgi:hypothetical protein
MVPTDLTLDLMPNLTHVSSTDTSPPQVVAILFSSSLLEIKEVTTVPITITVEDQGSGIAYCDVQLVWNPTPPDAPDLGTQRLTLANRTSSNPSSLNSLQLAASFQVPPFMPTTAVQAQVQCVDRAGLRSSLSNSSLFNYSTQRGPDVTAPELAAISIFPGSISTANASFSRNLSIAWTDDKSGVQQCQAVLLYPGNAARFPLWSDLGTSTKTSGSTVLPIHVPKGAPPGMYTLTNISCVDFAGHAVLKRDFLTFLSPLPHLPWSWWPYHFWGLSIACSCRSSSIPLNSEARVFRCRS